MEAMISYHGSKNLKYEESLQTLAAKCGGVLVRSGKVSPEVYEEGYYVIFEFYSAELHDKFLASAARRWHLTTGRRVVKPVGKLFRPQELDKLLTAIKSRLTGFEFFNSYETADELVEIIIPVVEKLFGESVR